MVFKFKSTVIMKIDKVVNKERTMGYLFFLSERWGALCQNKPKKTHRNGTDFKTHIS